MGAWGVGIFEDDAAYEWVDKILDSDEPEEIFESIFVYALDTNYVEYDDCHGVTVCAAIIDMLVNKTNYDLEDDDDLKDWVEEKRGQVSVKALAPIAVRALKVIIGKKSELNELWQENEEEYDFWKDKIERVMARLSAVKQYYKR
jgi:Domain of unknown function (DUF4259)